MKRALVILGLCVCVACGYLLIQRDANADPADQPIAAAVELDVDAIEAEEVAKKCSFNSDCKYGKCKSGKCGGCSFNSDCNGWGKCKSGWCGGCSFNSECKGFGSCSSGKCTKSPY